MSRRQQRRVDLAGEAQRRPGRSSAHGRRRAIRSSSAPPSATTSAWRAGQAAAVRGDQRGAGAGAAGQGQAGAAFPHPQPDAVAGDSTCAKPILARSGNSGSCSSTGPSSPDRWRADVRHEERRVRIAHAGGGGVGNRPERQRQDERVHRPAERNVAPVPAAAGPMSTATRPVRRLARLDQAGDGSRITGVPGRFRASAADGDAARGVAAGLGLAAVGVADAHEGVGAGLAWAAR